MHTTTTPTETFVPAHEAAARLGVPAKWLRDQARAGLLPHLKASRRVLFNVEAVEKALLERARQASGEAST